MVKEKMAELKIKVPECWLNFIDEYCQVTGRDRDEELWGMVRGTIECAMIEDELLPKKDRIRLIDKYRLTDIYKIPQWWRDEAAGIKAPVKTITPDEKFVKLVVDAPKFKPVFDEYMKSALKEAFIKGLDALSPEEQDEIWTASRAA